MAKAEHPRRKLIIKIFSDRSKVSYSCGTNTPKDSIVSKVCELKNKKGHYAMAMWVNTENPSESCVTDSRFSRTEMATWVNTKNPSEVSELKKKEGTVCVECKSREKKKRKVEHVMKMDRCKKMQFWAMVKRLMVGRDAWALQKDVLHPKISYVLDKSEAMKKPKGLEDIESKLKNSGYSEADEVVDDVRLVLSYALQYPPRSEVHRTATRISEGFELNWKTMKEKWMREEKETNKICKRELHVCPNDDDGEVHGKVRSYLTKGAIF